MVIKINKHILSVLLFAFLAPLCAAAYPHESACTQDDDNGKQEDEEREYIRQKLSIAEQRKFDYFFYEGLRLKNAEKFDSSFEMFRYSLNIDSTSSAALFELANYHIQLEQGEKAVAMIKKAVAYSPDNLEYHNTLASLLLSLGMYGEAAAEYEILAKASPNNAEINYYLAEAYIRMGEIGKAIDTYDALENLVGMNESFTLRKYHLYMTLEQKENAFDELKKLADKHPLEARYPVIIGDLYLQQNDNEQALKYFSIANKIDPESPYYPVSMANYYEKTGQRDSAKQQINAALINERLDIDTKLGILGQYITQLQRANQGLEDINTLLQTLTEQHPDELRLRLAYGELLASQKKFEEARFQYQLVTETEPENIDAWQQLLSLSFTLDDFDEAIRICKKCNELFPDVFEFYLYMGIAYSQKQDYQSAIDTYTAAIDFIPKENTPAISDFYGQIGDTYFKIKDTKKAFEAYEKALQHNERNTGVLNNYAYYLSLLKQDLAKAKRMSAQTIKAEPDNATYLDTYAWIFFKLEDYILAKLYIEQAIAKNRTNSAELFDHYGDILYMMGDKEKALQQWIKAKEQGKNSTTLIRKIEEKTYFEDTEEEVFN